MPDSSTLSWLKSEVLVFIFAAIGGIVVIIGLWWEYKATDESRYENAGIDEFRSLKSLEKKGEKWVIFGIVIEVIVAVAFACRDDWHIRNIEKNSDPLNLPISQVFAILKLEVKGTNLFSPSPNFLYDGSSSIEMMVTNIYAPSLGGIGFFPSAFPRYSAHMENFASRKISSYGYTLKFERNTMPLGDWTSLANTNDLIPPNLPVRYVLDKLKIMRMWIIFQKMPNFLVERFICRSTESGKIL